MLLEKNSRILQTPAAEITFLSDLINLGIGKVEKEGLWGLGIVTTIDQVDASLIIHWLFVFSLVDKGCFVYISWIRADECFPFHGFGWKMRLFEIFSERNFRMILIKVSFIWMQLRKCLWIFLFLSISNYAILVKIGNFFSFLLFIIVLLPEPLHLQ